MIRLIHGDCLVEMQAIPDKSVDMVLCDLPYGTTVCKWDVVIPFDRLWEQYRRIVKDNGAILLFGSEPFSTKLRMSNIKYYRYDWYWEKERGSGFAMANKQPLRKIENICVFYKKQPKYDGKGEKLNKPYKHALPIVKSDSSPVANNNLQNKERIYVVYEYSKKHNILRFSRKTKGCFHPTQKPVALLEYLIKTYSNEGDTILDNTMGSGSTGVACVNTGRSFIGIELEQEYFDIAKSRIEEAERMKMLEPKLF